MEKTVNIDIQIAPDLKERAEAVLASLGIPASNAVSMFYEQIVRLNGQPFIMDISEAQTSEYPQPLDMSKMTEEELNAEIQKGYDEIQAGLGIPAEQAFAELYKELGI